MSINFEIERRIKQIQPFESGWTFNFLSFTEDTSRVRSLPVVALALVEWVYPNGEQESYVEPVCLEEGGLRPASLLYVEDADNVYTLGLKQPGATVTQEEIERGTNSYNLLRKFKSAA